MASRIEDAFRSDAGRILGAVTAYAGDLQLAEDAVQEATLRALMQEADGRVIDNPAAWITTSARRLVVDAVRRARTAAKALPMLAADAQIRHEDVADFSFRGDERLELILTVCHPELAAETRLALALRFVCGVPTRDVAAMLLVSEPTMAARLTRAKKHLHDSALRFAMTDPRQVSERLPDALSVIALTYTVGYAAPSSAAAAHLRADAVELARDAYRVTERGSESAGLLALLLLTEARHITRTDALGDVVELADADRSRWDRAMLDEGEALATEALRGGTGRFALQAGIAGLHALAPTWEATDWETISRLYDGLVELWPSPPARLARIVARAYTASIGPAAARLELDSDEELFAGSTASQCFAVRGELDVLCDDRVSAVEDFRAACARATDPAVRRHLERRIAAVDR